MKLDIRKLKQQLTLQDYEQILQALDIPIQAKTDKVWHCLSGCHNINSYSGGANLRFYLDTKTFKCFSHDCDVNDIIALVQTRLQLLGQETTFMDAVSFIVDNSHIEIDNIKRIAPKKKEGYDYNVLWSKFIKHENVYSEVEEYDPSIIGFFDPIYPLQWINEGISIESMAKYQIGYYPRLQCTTIPCYNDENEIIGIRCRNWLPELVDRAKYIPVSLLDGTTYKFATSMAFYGINHNLEYIKKSKRVILVEGEKAVLKSDTWFGDKSITLGMYGKNLGKYRANQLVKWGIEKCTIAIDNDFEDVDSEEYEDFVKSVNKIWQLLSPYMTVDVCYNNMGYKDMYKQNIFDFDRERFDILWKERELIE